MEEEKTIWSGSMSQIVNLGAFLLSGLVFVLLLGLLVFVVWPHVTGNAILVALALLVVALPLFYAFAKWLTVKMLRYEVTSQRIRITTGILSKRTTALELYRVKDYEYREPFFMRLFKFGDLVISTSDESDQEMVLHAVPRVRWLADQLRLAVEARRDLKRVRQVDFDGDQAPPEP